jgi:branched-chain amino acid transport system substrate-binding protein
MVVTHGGLTPKRLAAGLCLGLSVLMLGTALTACSSTNTPSAASSPSSTKSTIPPAAFTDHTGITSTSVALGNISTLTAGLFKGSVVGTNAYAAYVNSQGGINGRKLTVDSYDDGFAGALNKQYTQAAVQKDFALVGSFSLEDNFGGTVLAANPQVANMAQQLDPVTNALPNSFSPNPAAGGWQLGPLAYFQKKFPSAVLHAGALIANYGSAITVWDGEKAAMNHLGYNVVYDPTFAITQTDFTQNVVAMKGAGVKILFMEQMPENYASAVIRALNQQNFHPVVVFGTSAYSEALVPNSGGANAIDGAYLEQNTSLFLGEDAASIPAVGTFLSWVEKASPGFKADYYTLSGWLSAAMFTQALRAAGPHPSRGSLLQSLRNITSFSGGNLIGTSNPAAKTPSNCYIIAQIAHGQFQRVDDPPVSGPTHGYRCDQPYYHASK